MTPGNVRTTSTTAVCTTRTSTVRNVSQATKTAVYAAYHRTYPQVVYQHGRYEIDHLISLELGGSNAPSNLWPEVYGDTWGAHVKDTLENALHKRVCAGKMTLSAAQRAIAHDWIQTYKRLVRSHP